MPFELKSWMRRATLVAASMLTIVMLGSSSAQAAPYGEQQLRWPGGVVYYGFAPSAPSSVQVATQKAVNMYNYYYNNLATGVRLQQVDPATYPGQYVQIFPTTGPSSVSHIGYHPTEPQSMWLNTTAPWQVALHEFGHVIGLSHEHQRCERDDWVKAPDSGETVKHCKLPTAEAYNPLSIMHYSDAELQDLDASLKPGVVAPPKHLHPGLVDSDLRTIMTMYRSDGAFSMVSAMNGKCLEGPPVGSDGTAVRMLPCSTAGINQQWVYSAASGELKIGGKCLDAVQSWRLVPSVVARDCAGTDRQRWDVGKQGELLQRATKDGSGRPLCAGIRGADDGAQLALQSCHRGESQLWRRSADGTGGSTVSVVSDLTPPYSTEGPRESMCADTRYTNGQLYLWDCGPSNVNQRFIRTAAGELRLHNQCADGRDGQVGDGVRLVDCTGVPSQRWALTSTGTLSGINGLCVDVTNASSANGTLLVLATCNDSSTSQRWSFRDPR